MAGYDYSINYICQIFGLEGDERQNLRAELQNLTEAELNKKLQSLLCGNKNISNIDSLKIKYNLDPQRKVSVQNFEITQLTKEEAQNLSIDYISQNLQNALNIYLHIDDGKISEAYDAAKNYFEAELSSKNVGEVINKEQDCISFLMKAKEGALTKREYYEQNKARLIEMLSKRMEKFYETGISALDKYLGSLSKSEFKKRIDDYITEMVNSIETMEEIKDLQHELIVATDERENQIIEQLVKNATTKLVRSGLTSQYSDFASERIDNNLNLHPFNSDELMTFEETFELERGIEFSETKFASLQQNQGEMSLVTGAYNKLQSLKTQKDKILDEYSDATKIIMDEYGHSISSGDEPNSENRKNQILELFEQYYSANPKYALNDFNEIIKKQQQLGINLRRDENNQLQCDFDTYLDSKKNKALNSLLKVMVQSQENRFEGLLGGRSYESYIQSYQESYSSALGQENVEELTVAMQQDQMNVIDATTGVVSLAGMGVLVVGGAVIAAPIALGWMGITAPAILTASGTTAVAGGALALGGKTAISGMVSRNVLGFTEATTRDDIQKEELERRSKDLVLDLGGMIVGAGAGKTGLKYAAEAIKRGSGQLSALLIEHGTDVTLSVAGDLAMIGLLDYEQGLKETLKQNGIGLLVSTLTGIKTSKALFDSNTKPAVKTYQFQQVNTSTSGKLYCGLPLQGLIRALGKKSNAVTLNDVVTDYLKQRYVSMKRNNPEAFDNFMSQTQNGTANPLISMDIDSRTFVEDVLFNQIDISMYNPIEFRCFQQKFNIEGLTSDIELLLDSYRPRPQTQVSTQVNTPKETESTKNKETSENLVAKETGNQVKSKEQDVVTRVEHQRVAEPQIEAPRLNLTEEIPDRIEFEAVAYREFNDAHQRGRKPDVEKDLIKIILGFKTPENLEIYNGLVDVYNRFCGANRTGNKEPVQNLLNDLRKARTYDDINSIIKKYMELEVSPEHGVRKKSADNDTEAVGTKKGVDSEAEVAPQKPKTKGIVKGVISEADKQVIDTTFSKCSEDVQAVLADFDLKDITYRYLKNLERSGRELDINKLKNNPNITKLLSSLKKMHMSDYTNVSKQFKNDFDKVYTEIQSQIMETRANFVEQILKDLDQDSSATVRDLVTYLNENYKWDLDKSKFDELTNYIEIKENFKENYKDIKKIFGDDADRYSLRFGETDVQEFMIEICKTRPDFNAKDLQFVNFRDVAITYKQLSDDLKDKYLNKVENATRNFDPKCATRWQANSSFRNQVSFEDYLELHNMGFSDGMIIGKNSSILNLIGVDNIKEFKKKLPKIIQFEGLSPKEAVSKTLKVFKCANLAELNDLFDNADIKSFKIKFNEKNSSKHDLELDFSAKPDMPLKERINVIMDLYKRINGSINKKSAFSDEISEKSVLQEILHQVLFDKGRNFGDYEKLIRKLSTDVSTTEDVKVIEDNKRKFINALKNSQVERTTPEGYKYQDIDVDKFKTLYEKNNENDMQPKKYNENGMQQILEILRDPELDDFGGLHAKMRFHERFFGKSAKESVKEFTDLLNSKLRIRFYDNDKLNQEHPQCSVPYQDKWISLPIDKDGKFHTLFFNRFEEKGF
ncbi:MAG: hypothetical protein E7Z89_02630 [Cyanobacteria bacterium SIG28]|nr:hypothetical protein [Cyanobacteria bacterium SIG28]